MMINSGTFGADIEINDVVYGNTGYLDSPQLRRFAKNTTLESIRKLIKQMYAVERNYHFPFPSTNLTSSFCAANRSIST